MNNNFLDFKIPENYGKGIMIIASDTFRSFLREKRFYISFAYYFALPIFLLFLQFWQFCRKGKLVRTKKINRDS